MCRSQRPHIANLRAVVCVGRLPDPITGFAGPALPTTVRDQSEHEPLAPAATPDPRRAAEQFVHGTDDGGEGKRHDRSHVEVEGCGSHCCSPAQVGSVERRIVRADASGLHRICTHPTGRRRKSTLICDNAGVPTVAPGGIRTLRPRDLQLAQRNRSCRCLIALRANNCG